MTTWLAVVFVGIGSYALRLAPLAVPQRLAWSDGVDRALRHAGTAALVYLVIATAMGAACGGWPAAGGIVAGLLTGLVVALRGRRPAMAIGTGLAVGWLAMVATLALSG